MKFAHLHVHTEYSLLDGLSNIKKLISHIQELNMDTVAVTDHGAMYGAVEFYKEARKAGVKPIIGMEAYTTDVVLTERPERGKFNNYHLLLLAKNDAGYKNLMQLTSIAHLQGYYYRPRIDRETLAKYSEGLICTSACAQGEVAQALIREDYKEAKNTAQWFLEVFGKNYYLEMQRHKYNEFLASAKDREIREELTEMAQNEKTINGGVAKLSRELGIPLVATNDAHYIKKEDATAQDALVCIATGKQVSDVKRLRFIDSPSFYLTSPEEMKELFADFPDAIENTAKIAKECELEITLDKWYFPKFALPAGKTSEEYMEEKVWEGAAERFGRKLTPEVKDRLVYEMETIKQKGYATYFLIVSDLARWAQSEGIITNTRGSAAGSLVSYCLGIININPLKYNLPFERFLTPWRPSPPDIDYDIADVRREEVINYLIDKYGKDKVAQICTFGRMLSRAAVRDVARVLGYSYSVGDRIAKLVPPPKQGFPVTINKALEQVPELAELYRSDRDAKIVLDLAKQLEGNARHVSVHAAGVVIAPSDIRDFTPLQLDPEGQRIITQYDMDSLDPNISPGGAVGLLKFDLLGLRNLSILGEAIRVVREENIADIDLLKIPQDDKKTFAMLSRGETMGVFQLSGSGMTRYLKDLKPTRVEDLMAMVALYRPGPMTAIPEYIARKNGSAKVSYFDPRMKEYLDKSYGLLVYQDDVLLTAINIAGYTWEEADKFRKAIGKKIPEEMAKQHEKFVAGCVKNGMPEEKAQELFAMIETFAAYGFNKAHAASYGMVAYYTAYMKANFTVEYMCALLSAESGDTEKISAAINECRRMGIKVLPPDINESRVGFNIVANKDSLDGKAIRFGLSAIKNVGKAAIDAILEARKDGKFTSVADFLVRVDARKVNKRVLESLIKVGALSVFGNRAALLAKIDEIKSKVVVPKAGRGQQGLFGEDESQREVEVSGTFYADVNEFSDDELSSLERQLLGFSLSAKPISELLGPLELSASHKIAEIISEEANQDLVKVAAVITEIRVVVTKRTGQEMAFVKVEDGTGALNLVVFPKLFARTRDVWIEYKPLLVTGKVDQREEEAALIAESIETLDTLKETGSNLYIKVPKTCTTTELLALKNLLQENPGEQKVTLVFEGENGKIDLGLKVAWSETLAKQIAELLNSPNLPHN